MTLGAHTFMTNGQHESLGHFPPEFIFRAWAPSPAIRKVWVWDCVHVSLGA